MRGGSEGEWRMDEEEKDRDGVRGLSYQWKMKLSVVSLFFENTRKNFKSNSTNNNICYLNTISLQRS